MGNKIITEKDFWICTSGAAPAQLQGIRKSNKQKSKEVYITIADTSTSSWIDFGCTKNMLMNALIAAVVVIVVVALIVGTGGVAAIGLVGMMAIGAGAAVTAGVITAVEGALTCGQKNAGQREWKNYKKNLIFTGSYAVTGGSFMECKVGGIVKYSPKVKTWTDALLFAGTSYSLKLVECVAVGAGAGAGGFYMAPVIGGIYAGTTAFAWPSLPSIGGNLWAMIYGAKGEMAVMRGAGGADSLLHDWATKDNETAGGALDAFATGASGEYALGKKIHEQGYVTPSDVGYIALYIAFLGLNFKAKAPTTPKPKFNPEQNAEFIDTPENLGSPKDPEPPSTPKDGEAFEMGNIVGLRKQQAIEFYQKHNPDMDILDIESHIAGIDFTKPIEIIKLPQGKELIQFTKVNTEGTVLRGDYYTDNPNSTPSELGVSDKYNVRDPNNRWEQTQEVRDVVKETSTLPKDAEGLKSTSAEINDTWSRIDEHGNKLPVHTEGGGSQIYVPKSQFKK